MLTPASAATSPVRMLLSMHPIPKYRVKRSISASTRGRRTERRGNRYDGQSRDHCCDAARADDDAPERAGEPSHHARGEDEPAFVLTNPQRKTSHDRTRDEAAEDARAKTVVGRVPALHQRAHRRIH